MLDPLPVISRSLVYYDPDKKKYFAAVPPHAIDNLLDADGDEGGSLSYMVFLMKKKGWRIIPCGSNERLLELAKAIVKDGAICFEKQEQ